MQYRVSNVGEVPPARAKVSVMIGLGYIYMDLHLPIADAGRVTLAG